MRAKKMLWKKKLNLLDSMYFCCTEKKESFFLDKIVNVLLNIIYTIIQNSEDKNKDWCMKKSLLLLLLKVRPNLD